MAVSTIVGMAGCLSRIREHEIRDGVQSYTVNIVPVSHQSSLNQILISLYNEYIKEHPEGITRWDGKPNPLSLKRFYIQHLADEYIGELPFSSPLLDEEGRRGAVSFLCDRADSYSALGALKSAFEFDGGSSVPYADPVV